MGIDKIHKSMVLELDSIELEAGIGGYTAGSLVYLNNGTGILDTADTEEKARTCVGIADETKSIGEAGSVRMTGTVTFSGWTWNIGDEIWASPSVPGGLTTIASGSLLYVGVAVASNKIVITLKRTNTKATQNTITMTAGSGLAEGTWVYFDTADSKVKPLLATSNTDNIKLLGVVITPGVINNGDDVEILNFGIWNSSSPIAGAIGDRWLSITVAGELQATAPISTKAIWVGSKVSTSTMFVSLGRQGDNGSNYPLLSANQIQSFTGGQQVEMLEGIKTDTINELTPTAGVTIGPKTITPEIVVEEIKNAAGSTFFGKRQTVVAGRRGKVHADFLEADTGLAVNAIASPSDPIITSIANGFDDFGREINFLDRTESDINFTGLTANAENFLGLKKETNGTLTPIKTNLPPVYGGIFHSDRANKINASFNGTDGDTEFVDEYGNFFRAFGSGWQISNVNQYSGMNTLRCNGINNSISDNRCEVITSLDTRSLDQWTLEGFFYADAMNLLATQPIFTAYPSGAPSGGIKFTLRETDGTPSFSLSSNESTTDIWASVSGVPMSGVASRATFGNINTGGTFGMPLQPAQWYHFAWVFDGLRHRVYLNGYLICVGPQFNNSEVFSYLKPGNFNKIWLGAEPGNLANKLAGNISNFAFHPYAKYQTKKFAVSGDTPAVRDIFTPPSVPLSLATQDDRYMQNSEAIYLDFESAADGDVLTKDLYGRQLTCFGNDNATLTRGGFIEAGAAKFGTKSLYFSGVGGYNNAAYIKAPVWADKWTVEFWALRGVTTATSHCILNLVVPGVLGTQAFQLFFSGNGANNKITVYLGSTDSSPDILNAGTSGYTYDTLYHHIAASYDGVTYRFFVDGSLISSAVSQLKISNGSHFIFGRNSNNGDHLNGKIDDFAYVPYCKYTGAFTPPTTALLSSMPEQYVFDTKKMQMYKGFPTAFVAENTVFVGEALTSINNIEKVITYALNGEYEERFNFDFLGNPAYRCYRSHRLGVKLANGEIRAINRGSTAYPRDAILGVVGSYYDGASIFAEFIPFSIVDRNLSLICLGYSPSLGPSLVLPPGAGANIPQFFNAGTSHFVDFILSVRRSF